MHEKGDFSLHFEPFRLSSLHLFVSPCHSLLDRHNLCNQLFASFQQQETNISQYISRFWMPQWVLRRLKRQKPCLVFLMHLIDNGSGSTFCSLQAHAASVAKVFFLPPNEPDYYKPEEYTCSRASVRTISVTMCASSMHCNSVDNVFLFLFFFFWRQCAPRSDRHFRPEDIGLIALTLGSRPSVFY